VSTVSEQMVVLNSDGTTYYGSAPTPVLPQALPLVRTIRNPSGITCKQSRRGIECQKGGHGFVIGDTSVVVHRGPNSTRYRWAPPSVPSEESQPGYPAPPTGPAPVPAPDPDVLPDAEAPRVAVLSCEDYAYRDVPQALLEGYPAAHQEAFDPDGDGTACGELQTFAEALEDQPGYEDVEVPSVPAQVAAPSSAHPSGRWAETCSGGSCYGTPSAANGMPRTRYVEGYYRRNGSYVGAHYRSR